MSILKNAVESIQVGVEDFSSDDERRSVSAMRNIAAGLLLLFKAKLCMLSPDHDKELLIKKDLAPAYDESGNLILRSKGKKTADVAQIRERLTNMKVDVDWKRVDKITNLRNEIEHYYVAATPDAVREVVAESFLLIRNFLQIELGQDPQTLLGDECWQVLLNTSDVYSAEENTCKASLMAIDWKYSTIKSALNYLRCSNCGSSLIEAHAGGKNFQNSLMRCKSCDHQFLFEDAIEDCVSQLLGITAHMNIKDGGDSHYGTCPHCDRETFVLSEGVCVACEEELEYTKCVRCSASLSLDDHDNDGLCSYCKYVQEKMMSE